MVGFRYAHDGVLYFGVTRSMGASGVHGKEGSKTEKIPLRAQAEFLPKSLVISKSIENNLVRWTLLFFLYYVSPPARTHLTFLSLFTQR